MGWQEELRTKFNEWNKNIWTRAKRNNYYAFSYEILRNKFALTFAYSTEKEKKKSSHQGGMGTEQNADAALHGSTPPLSSQRALSEMQADTGVRDTRNYTGVEI